MSRRWWISVAVGLIDDDGNAAVPWQALRAEPGSEEAEAWIELPTTRWGTQHRDLAARANFDYLVTLYPSVQRVRAVEEDWRALIVREVDAWRLEDVAAALAAGVSVSTACETFLMRRVVREQLEDTDLAGELQELIAEASATGAGRVLESDLDGDAVVQAYLAIAADTWPLPRIDAVSADFPAHDVVMERLVHAVKQRPELVTPMDGAPAWKTHERWVLG